jgi:hypothetical protein
MIHNDQVGSWDACQLKVITQLVAPRGTPGSFPTYSHLPLFAGGRKCIRLITAITASFVHRAWQWRILSASHFIVQQGIAVCFLSQPIHFPSSGMLRCVWSSGQSSWLQIQGSRLRLPALPDFLSSKGSGTRSTQPREDKWGVTWKKK